jgi:N-acyl homoserine lactone hydrolase
MWDVGAVPDSDWKPTGEAVVHHLTLPDGQTREVTLRKPLTAQLKACGFAPKDIRFLALSHYHYDHTANANSFAHSTWLVRQNERDAMFAGKAPGTTQPSSYAGLRDAKSIIIDTDDYDVFGDATVMIKFAPGHTPGHQMLLVKLAKTGPVLLSGDLYHYPQELALDRVPTFEFNAEQTRKSRLMINDYIEKTGTHLWIQHDLSANEDLRKAPEFYE